MQLVHPEGALAEAMPVYRVVAPRERARLPYVFPVRSDGDLELRIRD